MNIQNRAEIIKDKRKHIALDILQAGLDAASPEIYLKKHIKKTEISIRDITFDLSKYSSVYTVAFGKAADSMTRAANHIIDIKSGFVVIPDGTKPLLHGKKFTMFHSSHPTPNQVSVNAAKAITKFLKKRKKTELVIFLVSGGASALLSLPDSVEFSDKTYANDLLLRCGATIEEFNCVRKHLSKIKGGKLVENLPCDAVSLVISDVQGDDLTSIASGTTFCDKSTFSDALEIIKKYKLQKKLPDSIFEHLYNGKHGKIPETPKEPVIPNYVIATNQNCIDAMVQKAKDLGYKTKSFSTFDDVKDVTRKIVQELKDNPDTCIIFGGEPTVTVLGDGLGGRNQELVLRILKNTQNQSRKMVIASIGTDGIDGNTKYAGALTKRIDIDVDEVKTILKNSDSNSFFIKYKGLVNMGYTHTNLMDIGLVLP